jgi:hypothetical protein
MARYHTLYIKKHYVKKAIRRDIYAKLVELCDKEYGINLCLEKLLKEFEKCRGASSAP